MNKSIVTLLMMFVISSCLFAQTGVNYYPKSLKSELIKQNGYANPLRELTVSEQLAHCIKSGKFFYIADLEVNVPARYIYVGRVNTCRAGGCSINRVAVSEENSEYFDYFILFDSGLKIRQVKIFNYQASHGYEVTSANWLKQFKNYDGSNELIAGKNVDAISGATISVDATTFDIEHKTHLLKQIINNSPI